MTTYVGLAEGARLAHFLLYLRDWIRLLLLFHDSWSHVRVNLLGSSIVQVIVINLNR